MVQQIDGSQQIRSGSVGAPEIASTAVTPAIYGSATQAPVLTVDQDGRITAAANAAIAGVTPSDGDKGDITVSASGATWTIDNDTVTYAKAQNVSAASRILGRGSAAGAGDPQELTLGMGVVISGTAIVAQQTWDFNFTDDGEGYFRAYEAMTVALGDDIGTATLTYEKSTTATPATFASTSLPTSLEAGAFLKVIAASVVGFSALQIVRTA